MEDVGGGQITNPRHQIHFAQNVIVDESLRDSSGEGHPPSDDNHSEPCFTLSEPARSRVAALVKGTLNRLALLPIAPQAQDGYSPGIKLDTYGENSEATKSRSLENAKTVHCPCAAGSKLSKFAMEAAWLQNVLHSTLNELENEGTFSSLLNVVEEHEANERRTPEKIEHVKSLNAEMHVLRQTMHTEAVAHKNVLRELQRSLADLKQGIKDFKKQNKLTYKFRLDIAVATAECHRRVREERLKVLKDEIDQLSNDFEIEKRSSFVAVEFLKKQNLRFMEEAISLAAAHDNDIHHMEIMLRKLRDQKEREEELLAVLEPRYVEEMAQKKAAEEKLEKQKNISVEEQGELEVTTRAAMKIQKIWRGNRVRVLYSKELKNMRKKKRGVKSKGGKKKK